MRTFIVFCFVLLSSQALSRNAPLDGLWQKAVEKADALHFAEAAPLFESWIEKAAAENIRSAEAHYNLANCYYHLEDIGKTQFHLLRGLDLTTSPIEAYNEMRLVSYLETQLGLNDKLSDKVGFYLPRIFPRNLRLLLLGIGVWILISSATFFSLSRISKKLKRASVWALPFGIVLVLGSAGVFALSYIQLPVGVLYNQHGPIHVYEEPSASEDKKLVSLPSGTLVRWKKEENGFILLDFPVAAWVKPKSLLKL